MNGSRRLGGLTCRYCDLVQPFDHVAGGEHTADRRLLMLIDEETARFRVNDQRETQKPAEVGGSREACRASADDDAVVHACLPLTLIVISITRHGGRALERKRFSRENPDGREGYEPSMRKSDVARKPTEWTNEVPTGRSVPRGRVDVGKTDRKQCLAPRHSPRKHRQAHNVLAPRLRRQGGGIGDLQSFFGFDEPGTLGYHDHCRASAHFDAGRRAGYFHDPGRDIDQRTDRKLCPEASGVHPVPCNLWGNRWRSSDRLHP